MLRGFRKPKFFTKCKSDIKITKLRFETIKKKRSAVQKYLKNDIVDLLRSGLDINAYGRAEGLLVEQNMSACYELTENFIGCISNNLSLMQNQSECPEECREAVPSLMYAAARFADLPELRDLRNMFTERYGNSLEPFVNKELVERLKAKPPTKEMKIQLLHDIAQEFSIEWDSKALEQKLYTPSPLDQGQRRYGSPGDSDDDMQKSHKSRDNSFPKRKNQDAGDVLSHRTKNTASVGSEDETTTDVSQDAPKYCSSSVGSTSGDEADNKTPFYSKFAPPPYYKPKPERKESSFEEPTKLNSHVETDHHNDVSVGEDDPKPRSVRRKNLKPPPGRENLDRNDPRDEEERVLDGLLMHYSKKQSPYESKQMKGNLSQVDNDAGESANRSRRSQRDAPSARASSLPPEPTSPIEAPKRHDRTNSLQPDAHVHPKLPEYDELAARIAALRGI
ncbi:PREDICTED: uncharacterized protein LOC103327924 [Prunus mume]|uniref:Uncharacterized protein LOC103327924 n=1 Tax=Prunus mume TaxID=102107 RepID=A0ABM0NQZ7_PRUMU|nr:PREDICTED: uncharacterized protein LOC103327924 [Prunus mume]